MIVNELTDNVEVLESHTSVSTVQIVESVDFAIWKRVNVGCSWINMVLGLVFHELSQQLLRRHSAPT